MDPQIKPFFYHMPKDRMAIELLMENMGLTEIWMLVKPKDREYTFYSHKHKSHSRIDHFLIRKDLVNSVSDSSIGPVALTDSASRLNNGHRQQKKELGGEFMHLCFRTQKSHSTKDTGKKIKIKKKHRLNYQDQESLQGGFQKHYHL